MDVDTVIVGAGQTGLATAYELKRRGITALVLDGQRRVGDQWRVRYASLRLNTPARYDSLPGMPFPAPPGAFPTGADMGDYLEAYAERMGLDVRPRTGVTAVTRDDDGTFRVDAGDRSWYARNVVLATGSEQVPSTPAFAGELDPGIRQLHSSGYRDPSQLLPGPVLVVGAGQSGADLALEMARAGHETWLAGRHRGQFPFELGTRRAAVAFTVLWFLANHVLSMSNPLGRRIQPAIRAAARRWSGSRPATWTRRGYAGHRPGWSASTPGARRWPTVPSWTSATWCGAPASRGTSGTSRRR